MLAYDRFHQFIEAGSTREAHSFEFSLLSDHSQLVHRIFTRRGGVSRDPYKSLNISYDTDDRHEDVKKNLHIIRDSIGARDLFFMHQIHGKNISILKTGHPPILPSTPYADAVITNIPYIALMVKQADCQGIILYDPVNGVVSVTHCGWKGNTINILGSVVERMVSGFQCKASNIFAAIGPSLGPCCGEFTTYRKIFPPEFRDHMVRESHFNLWEVSRGQLLKAGLRNDRIETAGICTRCNTDLFYSYRGEGITGRFGTVAMLRDGKP